MRYMIMIMRNGKILRQQSIGQKLWEAVAFIAYIDVDENGRLSSEFDIDSVYDSEQLALMQLIATGW